MNQISVGKIIKNDYAAFLLTILGPVFLVGSVYIAVVGFIPRFGRFASLRKSNAVHPLEAQIYIWVALILTGILFLFLVKRISRLKRILETGHRTKATVTGISFYKDRGRIEFQYVYRGKKHSTGTAIMKNKQTEKIAVGNEIDVAVDQQNDKKAFIVSLYLKS